MTAVAAAEAALASPRAAVGRQSVLRAGISSRRGILGLSLVTLVVLIAVFGPFVAPHSPSDFVAQPYTPAGGGLVLGADSLGRDVLSDVLAGGRTILLEATAATILGVGLGVLLGIATGYTRSWVSTATVRVNDAVIALPQLVVTLLILSRLHATPLVLVLVVAIFHIPMTARVTRTATLRVVQENYVSSAELLGISRRRILLTEILPNITAPCFVEFALRYAFSIALLASLGYLGFGSVAINWGRMIYENQGGISIQPWGVLAPAIVMGVLTIGVSLVSDALARAATRRDVA